MLESECRWLCVFDAAPKSVGTLLGWFEGNGEA